MTEKILSSGLEDYLEEIYIAHINNTPLKGAELARKMNISRASVSEALSKLVAKKLINYSSYEAISLTIQGFEEAKKVYEKHHTLKNFFEKVLDIPSDEASENACKIEHIISQNVLNKMTELTKFYETHTELIKKLKEENTK
uniref:Transcriptional regulator n=1 Tax=uncultured Candidatus Melainabacteria bacterium TaxID=2682970 RepID=A0A650EKM9_9BACT|nr:transcriptional regulator [uncultured Candidatus Melainabacteria bacterium]